MTYLPLDKVSIKDYANRIATTTTNGDLNTSNKFRQVSIKVRNSLTSDVFDWTNISFPANTSRITANNLITFTASNGASCSLETAHAVISDGNETKRWEFEVAFGTPSASVNAFCNVFNGNIPDTYSIGYNGVNFCIGYQKGASPTYVTSSGWNGQLSSLGLSINPAILNNFAIEVGLSTVSFEVYIAGTGWVVIHSLYISSLSGLYLILPLVGSKGLKFGISISGSTTPTGNQIIFSSCSGFCFSDIEKISKRNFCWNTTNVITVQNNLTPTPLLSLRLTQNFNSSPNISSILLNSFSYSTSTNNALLIFQVHLNSILTGAVFTNRTGSDFSQWDTSATSISSVGFPMVSVNLGSSGFTSGFYKFDNIRISYPQTVTIVCQSTSESPGGTKVFCTLNWSEIG